MVKAKAMHRDMLRNERVERMLLLDYEWMNATREKDQAAIDAIDAKKVALLDITDDPRIDASTTVEELKAVTLPTRG
jgi:cation transport ATPase